MKLLAKMTISAALVLPMTAAIACAQDVHTDYDHKADFAAYHTFSVYKVHASNPLMETRFRDDIVQALSQRGYREVPQGGDLAVTAIGNVTNQQEYTTFYDGMGGWGYGGWRGWHGWGGWGGGGMGTATTTAYNVPVGTLVVDLYDNHTRQLVFRGTASDELSKNPDKNSRKGEKAIDKIFDKLPKNNMG